MNSPESVSVTPERIMQFAWGYAPPLILEAAIKHRVFDVLDRWSEDVAGGAPGDGCFRAWFERDDECASGDGFAGEG